MRYAVRILFQSQTSAARNFRNKLKTPVFNYIVKASAFACNQSKVTDAAHQLEVFDG